MQKIENKIIANHVGALSVRNTYEKDPIAPSKNHNGITLIALIITIIVMLILVAVTVTVALNGGLFTTAKNTANLTQVEIDREVLQPGVVSAILSESGITKESLLNNLPEGWDVITSEETLYTATSPNGNKFTVSSDGNISYVEPEIEKIISANDPEAAYWKTNGEGTIIYYEVPEGVEVPETLIVPCQIGEEKITKIGDYALCGAILQRKEDGSLELDTSGYPTTLDEVSDEGLINPTGATTKIKNIIISKGITNIGNTAFGFCTLLEAIKIPEKVTNIGEGAFGYCTSLKNIAIPEGVTNIGNSVFMNCISLEAIKIPEKVTNIDDSAFRYCKSIETVIIPEGVTNIGEDAFADCTNLKTVYFKQITAPKIGSGCFSKSEGEITTFYFKNSKVYDALQINRYFVTYNSKFGIKSTDYNW